MHRDAVVHHSRRCCYLDWTIGQDLRLLPASFLSPVNAEHVISEQSAKNKLLFLHWLDFSHVDLLNLQVFRLHFRILRERSEIRIQSKWEGRLRRTQIDFSTYLKSLLVGGCCLRGHRHEGHSRQHSLRPRQLPRHQRPRQSRTVEHHFE